MPQRAGQVQVPAREGLVALTVRRAGWLGAFLAAALLVYSLGFCVAASTMAQLQRPNWDAVAARLGEPQRPRAMVTWTLGEAPLRHYLSTGSFQVRASERFRWRVGEIDLISQGHVPPPGRHVLGPGFREAGHEAAGPLFIRRYRLPGPGLAPLRLRHLRDARLNFRTNGVLLDGIGPG